MSAPSSDVPSAGGEPQSVTPPSAVRKGISVVLTVFFCLFISSTLVIDMGWPVPAPKLLGQEKAREDELRKTVSWLDGTKCKVIERDLRFTSRVRRSFISYYAAFLFLQFGEAKSEARVGRDGWVYLGERVDLLSRPATETVLPAISMISAVNRRFASNGVKLILAPIPRKSEVYPEHLPRGFDPRRDLYPILTDGLARAGVTFADLRTAFAKASDRVLYYVYDSHWNDDGQLVAAEEVARVAGLWKPESERDTEIKFLDMKPDPGDIVKMIGIAPDSPALEWIPRRESKRFDVKWKGKGGKLLAKAGDSKKPPTIAISGTSFTANTRFPKYIRHFTNEGLEMHAWPGAGSVDPLRRLVSSYVRGKDKTDSGPSTSLPVESRPARLPQTVVWEMQMHDVLCVQFPLRNIGNVFAELAPKRVTPLGTILGPETEVAFAKTCPLKVGKHTISTRSLTGWIDANNVAFSPDGSIGLRLRGNVSGKPIDVVISTETISYTTQWKPGQADVVLPILCTEPDPKLRVAIRTDGGEAGLNLKGVEFTTDVDPASRREGTRRDRPQAAAEAEATDDRWPAPFVYEFAPPVVGGRNRLLVLTTTQTSPPHNNPGTVTLHGPSGEAMTLAIPGIDRHGAFLMGIPASFPEVVSLSFAARRTGFFDIFGIATATIYSQ